MLLTHREPTIAPLPRDLRHGIQQDERGANHRSRSLEDRDSGKSWRVKTRHKRRHEEPIDVVGRFESDMRALFAHMFRLPQPCRLHILRQLAKIGKKLGFHLPTRERQMNTLRGLIFGCMAVTMLSFAAPTTAEAGFGLLGRCCAPVDCCEPVCCPPPPVAITWAIEDPCNCCTYEVTACVPACCGDAAPELVCCRAGIFGRKVMTFSFGECGHTVDVVITKHGRTIVRD